MPAKSRSQLRWARLAFSRGEITKEELDKFTRVEYKKLPERVKAKKKQKRRVK